MYNAHLLKIAIIVQIFATSVIAQESTVEKAKEVLVMNVKGEQSLIGQTAPELNIEKYLQAPEGEKSLSALKGNVVVLEFWATWCAPCVAEIPHLNQLSEEFREKQVQFISITDEDEDVIAPFLKRQEMKSWIGLDTDRSAFEAYGVRGIPRTFLIDQKGIISASLHPVGLSSDTIEKVIKGEKIERPKLPKPKTVENEGTDPIFKILIAPTEKEGGRSSSKISKGYKQQEAESKTLHQILSMAYGVPTTRILGPETFLETRYEISVRLPTDQFELLFQQALTASLQLRVSNQKKSVEVFVLMAGEDSAEKLKPTIMSSSGSMTMGGHGKIKTMNGEISWLAQSLESVLERIVEDGTGIEGKYDWEITYDEDDPNSVLAALKEQLGLQIRKEQREIEFLVVNDTDG